MKADHSKTVKKIQLTLVLKQQSNTDDRYNDDLLCHSNSTERTMRIGDSSIASESGVGPMQHFKTT